MNSVPKTKSGKWAVGLLIPMVLVRFLPISSDVKYLEAGTTAAAALIVGGLALWAITKKKEKSFLVWLTLVVAILVLIFPLLWVAGEGIVGED